MYDKTRFNADASKAWKKLKPHLKMGATAPVKAGVKASQTNSMLFEKGEIMYWFQMLGQFIWFLLKLMFFGSRRLLNK